MTLILQNFKEIQDSYTEHFERMTILRQIL